MAKRKRYSHSGDLSIDFYGTYELLEKIYKVEGTIENALMKAMEASAAPIEADLLKFMAKHYRTGDTAASMTNVQEMNRSAHFLYLKLGFDIKKGGLPALFLDIGTPKIKPSFFVYYAFRNNTDNVKMMQMNALKQALRELM